MESGFEIQAAIDRLRVLFPNEPDISYREARKFFVEFWLKAHSAGYNQGFAKGRQPDPEQWDLPERK